MIDALKAKVVVVGPPGVGKTSLIRRYTTNVFDDAYRATLGAVVSKSVVDVRMNGYVVRVTLSVWDTTGEPGVPEAVRALHLHGAQGVLAVADATDARTVPALVPFVATVGEVAGDVPVHILLNKGDLEPATDAVGAGRHEGLVRGARVYVTSAKAGDNVARVFHDLARRIAERMVVPIDRPLEDVDFLLAVKCNTPRTIAEAAAEAGLAEVVAEARLERLRRQGYVRLASLDLDRGGRPVVRYTATTKPFTEIAARSS